MAKISKIRFVNFTYNDNRHIYDQTFDFYDGEDTLINLQNGGGKTVLVQMMMQPIIPKQKLKDRLFKSYFANSKAPVYIMIEWILDDSSKRVLTGIGIKKVLSKSIEDESESLKIVTFISEYEEENKFDIKNIELLEEERGIVRLLEYDKVIRMLSNAEKEGSKVWVFKWDLADDKKEYARRLLSYKINQLEWKYLMVRINEAEAGLNSFFSDCKTNSALIKKWFIPTIEDQLNKNGNFVENIKELIKNHTEQLVKNEDMISEREIFEGFKIKSADILKNLNGYGELLTKSQENKDMLGNAYLFIQKKINELNFKKQEFTTNIKLAEDDIKELEYEKLSGEYYEISSILENLKEKSFQADKKIAQLKVDYNEFEYKSNLIMCSKIKEELKNLNFKLTKFETELEKENLEQEDIKNIVQDIEYSLKEKYRDKIILLEKTIEDNRKNLNNEKNNLSIYINEHEKIKKDIVALNDDLITIRSRIAVFNETHSTLKLLYSDFEIIKNINTLEFDIDSMNVLKMMLDSEETAILKSIQDIMEKRSQNQIQLEILENELKELRNKYPILAIEKSKKETFYNLFENEKKAIYKVIKDYQLKDDCLFNREKVFILLNGDKEKYNKLISDRSLRNSILRKQYKHYEAGKAFELPEELKQIFEDKNILVEFGYEWLRSITDNKISKLKLVKNNPFLPYSLIVSQVELSLIKDIEFKSALSPVIPIIEREKLEKALVVKTRNNIHSVDNIDFLIAFDDRILNKSYLKEICDEITSKINENNKIIENAKEALKNIETNIVKLEGFSYTKERVAALEQELRTITSDLAEVSLEILDKEAKLIIFKKSEAADISELNSLENMKNRFMRKNEDCQNFIKKCDGYSSDLKVKKHKEEALKNEKVRVEDIEECISKTKGFINDENLKASNINAILERDKLNYQRYSDVKVCNFIDEDIEKLEAKLLVFTSRISGKIQSLKDILEDYKYQRNEKQKVIDAFGIEESLYLGKEFNVFDFENIKQELSKITNILKEISENKNDTQFKIAECNSDLKYMNKSIKEKSGYDAPKQREYIRDLDFDSDKALMKVKLRGFEKEVSQIKILENNLQRARFGLEEFSVFAVKIIEIQIIEGDLNLYVLRLIKEFKEFTVIISDTRTVLTSMYTELESEFTLKAEVFKGLFNSILEGEKRYHPVHALNAFNRVYLQIDRKLEQHYIDIKKIDNMETCIVDNTLSYLRNVYDEMNNIDRNSTIDVDGKRCKMLIINLPEKDELENISLKEYLKNIIRNCVSLFKHGKSIEGLLTNEISTYDLFDRLVSINKIEITLIKIEPNKLKKKTWKQVIEQNSGGEKFVSAFVVFISLLTYMRGENLLGTNLESKVLIMDNPFGPITSEHLLKPLFEIAKKYNTQMICLTDLKEHTIFDRFNLIYTLNIEREVGREDEYLELKIIKKDIHEEEDEVLSASMFKIEDKSRFELVN